MYEIAKRLAGPWKPMLARRLGTRYPAWVEWAKIRCNGLASLLPIYQGQRIRMLRPGRAICESFQRPGPGRGEVLVRSEVSALSQGTELAVFEQRPNPGARLPFVPGYQAVGTVEAIGRGVENLRRGQRVAAVIPHASFACVHRDKVFALPEDVPSTAGAFFQLGVVAIQGVRRAALGDKERVAVFGRGAIGYLVLQICRASGCSELISIAPSARHVSPALAALADRVLVTREEGDGAIDRMGVDVAIEVTGAPQALHDALRAVRAGGRVVLLGSLRGITRGLDPGLLADRDISLHGAHTSTLHRPSAGGGMSAAADGGMTYDEAYRRYLDLVRAGRIVVDDFIDAEIDPREGAWLYRHLADGSLSSVGSVFHWHRLESDARLARVGYARPPAPPADMALEALLKPRNLPPVGKQPARIGATSARSQPVRRAPAGELGVAIVGCGARGIMNARAVGQADHTELVRVCDPDGAAAQRLGQAHQVPWGVRYDEVLDDPAVDIAFLSSPHHVHAEQAIAAARAGKHVLVEKPMATTLCDAEKMRAVAGEHGVQLATWLGTRYWPSIVRARALIERGALGRLRGGQLTLHLNYSPSFWLRGDVPQGSDWRARWQSSGGGVLMTSAIHYLDWLLFLSGERVREVSAKCATHTAGIEVEDTAALWLTMEGGALLTANVSAAVPGIDGQINELALWGTDGHLRLGSQPLVYSSRRIEDRLPERWYDLGPLPRLRGAAVELVDRFAQAILEERPLEISADDGIAVQALIDGAYRSSRQGCTVMLLAAAERDEATSR